MLPMVVLIFSSMESSPIRMMTGFLSSSLTRSVALSIQLSSSFLFTVTRVWKSLESILSTR